MPIETYELLQTVQGDEALNCSSVFEWFKRFQDGSEDRQNDPRSGRPLTSRKADTVADVPEIVTQDRRWAVRMMADELNINKDTIRRVLREDLRKRQIRAK
jgi:ribosome-binding protein aMBF1 (putative translation factor)